jgi:transcriptional regulator with XRE-family HTH domain
MRGDRLRAIREQRGLTQQELAERCGLGINAVWKYENEESDPSGDVVARLAKELDVSSDYLLGLVDHPEERLQTSNLTPDQRRLLAAFESGDVVALLRMATKVAEEAQREESQAINVT